MTAASRSLPPQLSAGRIKVSGVPIEDGQLFINTTVRLCTQCLADVGIE